MPCRSIWVGSSGVTAASASGDPPTTSIPVHAAAQVRHGGVDAGVEQRDRDAASVDARHPDLGPVTGERPEVCAREHAVEIVAGYATRTG